MLTFPTCPPPPAPADLPLDPDILARARAHNTNLSTTIETLLCRFIHERQQASSAADAELTSVIAALNAHTVPFLSDSFPSL